MLETITKKQKQLESDSPARGRKTWENLRPD